MSPRFSAYLMAISQILAALIQTVFLGEMIRSLASWDKRGLSAIAHKAT